MTRDALSGRVRVAARAVEEGAHRFRGWVLRSARTPRGRGLLALLTVVALAFPALAGFLLVSAAGGADGGAGQRVATIGVMAPLSGASADAGVSVRNAVTLAVEEANEQGAVPGWRLEVVAHDDLSRPDGGAAGADLFAGDERTLGVVGPVSSSVAMVSLERLSDAGVPVISPANAEPTLTERPDSPDARPFPTYFRLSGTDAQLARAAADYAVHALGRSRISVVDGGPDYGMITLAERFARDVRDEGAIVPTVHRVDGRSADDEQVERTARAIRDEAPDLVYLATGAAFAGELRAELADEGASVQVLGADGLLDHDYVERAGSLADGDVITDLSVPLSQLSSAGAFVAAYTERFGEPEGLGDLLPDGGSGGSGEPSTTGAASTEAVNPDGGATERDGGAGSVGAEGRGDGTATGSAEDAEREREIQRTRDAQLAELRADAIPPVAAAAYDAARALIRAAAAVLPGRIAVSGAVRAAVVREVGGGEFAGVTGQVAFDDRGDLRGPRIALYSVVGERFVPLRNESAR
ncbi:amino acid/amide ABC transporter substrate-binding protein, HAAT family [Frankia sp. EI5c]|uniref:branched-chain amino acid ABC transporter substrate-binding protein n=1 Tax=Frankia sp. EI5c TaxID=683316 RepID=UPI0007C27C9E|nr:branched-chain amino acid ABC transporter substrate-binding protein [Frankia sp. EI5c]OAA28123.1 amino acid/amide ABC transporter substrate-binding protein, HAAT family [Frankia sp. EI5c]